MILRLLNIQGLAGLAVSLALLGLLLVQKGETRRWRKQSSQFEQLYRGEQAAFAGTVANYRVAAEQARAADKANAERVATEQRDINERSQNAFDLRLADARARAERLHLETIAAVADSSGGGSASMPGLSAAAERVAKAPGQNRLPDPDRLLATEQAIQLDELVQWAVKQHEVSTNGVPAAPQQVVRYDDDSEASVDAPLPRPAAVSPRRSPAPDGQTEALQPTWSQSTGSKP